jgi:hypothetical protein
VVLVHVPNPWLDESFLGNGLHAPLRFAPTGVRSLWGEGEGPGSKVSDLPSLKTLCTSRTR